MSDNKTIKDALAEVQRKVNEERAARAAKIIDEAAATILDPSGKKLGTTEYQRVPGSSVGQKAATAGAGAAGRSTLLKRGAAILGGPAAAGAITAASVFEPSPAGETKSEFQRQKEMGISPKPMSGISPAPSTTSSISPAPKTSTGRTGVGINKVMNRGKETPAEPLKMAKVEPKTFGQAFSAARKAATEKGSPSSGQFEFKGKTYQTNVKGEKYVAPPKQTPVKTTKEVPLPPKKPDDLAKPVTSDMKDTKPMSGISPAPKTTTTSSTTSQTPIKDFAKNAMSGNFETPIKDTITSKFSDGVSRPTDAPGKISNEPFDTSKPSTSKLTNLEYESGGKKKKMSEEMNPLVAAFLKLQETNPSNMFEAAKKAKKDYDKDGKIESEKDEVWGSRFRAAKAAGKMEEATLKDPKDPSVQGSGDVTISAPKSAAPAAAPVHVKPTNPEKLKNLKDPRDPSVQGSGDVTYKEEVQELFSAAELEHLNRFFNEASVAPKPGELAAEARADKLADGMSQNDVTGTAESGKKVRKEEVELDEKLTDEAKANIRTALTDKMKKTSGPARSLIKLAKMNPANVKEETLEEGRPKKNPTPETTERDPRKHIQVEAGRAAAGNVIDFPHNDGTKSKITPAMGRRIVAHLQGLKPADRQAAVNKMHDSAEGLKV